MYGVYYVNGKLRAVGQTNTAVAPPGTWVFYQEVSGSLVFTPSDDTDRVGPTLPAAPGSAQESDYNVVVLGGVEYVAAFIQGAPDPNPTIFVLTKISDLPNPDVDVATFVASCGT